MGCSPGSVIEFKDGQAFRLALVLEARKSLRVLCTDGKEMRISQKAISAENLKEWDPAEGQERLLARLVSFEDQVKETEASGDMAETWELLLMEGTDASLEEIAEILLGDSGSFELFVTERVLRTESFYFKQRKDRFTPRPEHQVQSLLQQRNAEEAARGARELFVHQIKSILDLTESSPRETILARRAALQEATADPNFRQRLDLLEQMILRGEEFDRRKQAESLLDELLQDGVGTPGLPVNVASRILTDLGLFSPNENMALRRAGWSLFPNEDELKAAQDLLDNLGEVGTQPQRLDLTEVEVITIDDASTRDVDDGLSIRKLPGGGYEVGIHIADPAEFVAQGHPLDQIACDRGTSTYLPEGVIPMFPRILSEGEMSLLENQVRPAISLFLTLDASMAIEDYRLELTRVRSVEKMTYDMVDSVLEGQTPHIREPMLQWLSMFAQQRLLDRLDRGGVFFQIPDPKVQVLWEDREVGLWKEVRALEIPDTPSRTLVQEMMILMGEIVGRFCEENEIPVLFRVQAPPDDVEREEELKGAFHDVLSAFEKRRWMRKGEFSTAPSGHFGLGLGVYVQATSPIRRYTDLICHRQIRAHLLGEEFPYEREDLVALCALLDARTGEASQLERESKRYWSLVYYSQRKGDTVGAMVVSVVDEGRNRVNLLLDDTAFQLGVSLRKKVSLGDRIKVKIETVDPRRDILSIRMIEG